MSRPRWSVGSPVAWAVTVVFVALMALWTVVTPAFRSSDEAQHVNSVLRLAEGGGWPAPSDAVMDPAVLRAKTLSGFSAVDGQRGNWDGGTLLPGVRPDIPVSDLGYYALFSQPQPSPPEARLPFSELSLTQDLDLSLYPDQMTQHPPLYYAVDAAVVRVSGADDWRFDRALALMRWVSIALVAPLPLLVRAAAVRLTGRRRVGDLAATLPLAIPQLAAVGGSVTNDALVIGVGGVLLLLVVRVLTGDGSWRTVLGIGLTLGLGLLTKGTLLVAVPVVGLALIVAGRRVLQLSWRQGLLRVAACWAVAFVVGGWWWALNLLRYGEVQPSGWSDEFAAQFIEDGPRDSLLQFVGPFTERMATSFWGKFGQGELSLPDALVTVVSLVLAGCVLMAFRQRDVRVPLAVLLALPVVTLVLLFMEGHAFHLENGQYGGLQGRYLFGALVPVLAAASVGVGTFIRPGRRPEAWAPVLGLLLALGGAAVGLWTAFSGYYIDLGWSVEAGWQRMTDWSPWPGWSVDGLAVGLVVLALGAVVVAVVSAVRDGAEQPWPGTVPGGVRGRGDRSSRTMTVQTGAVSRRSPDPAAPR